MSSRRKVGDVQHSGGRRQRLTIETAASSVHPHAASSQQAGPATEQPSNTFSSSVVAHILYEWAWGHMSAVTVQKLADASYSDQVALLTRLGLSSDHIDPTLIRIARLGIF